ncbi:aldehyde dehydrogenase [Bacillus sp. FJAT-27231]|uniref:aldehyde dehydrogenase family protein n=1 Tax=Bacillus sp. FJAT-27231 TaxID=1679168 RepID=UPI000670E13E|nr:aldehyde dehydrogenase family protein [Bacillus sp. FJAT-27231]KMY55476.1 aldehyde dehydrogenase [Bacillus sp. FJAT-27231]
MPTFEHYNKSFLNGEWTEGKSERTGDILNPYDESVIATVKLATKEQLKEAFETAKRAQKEWARTSAEKRRDILTRAANYLKENKKDVQKTISRETGGTAVKAEVELGLTIGLLEQAAKYTGELYEVKKIEDPIEGKVNHVHRLPLGVVSSISPFNFPMNLSMRTVAPAIALGNAVVHKPDLQTGLTGGVILAKAFEEAGLPKGVFNMILTDLEEIGNEMLENPIPRLISFTGSTPVGKLIGRIAGENFKRVALELGGNNPFIVLSDADVDRAVDAAIFGKFIHQGQICMIINRLIIHKDLYEEFKQKFIERVKELPAGDPSDPKTVIGPLMNKNQLNKAVQIIEKAKQEGINVALEGKAEGNVLTPYVFSEVDNSSELAQTELFAPIASLIRAETDEEALQMANDTQYGLSSAIFTTDLDRGEKLALQIDSGMTHINDQTVNDSPVVPFGGNKQSGMGRFGYPWVIEEFTVTKWVSLQTEYRKFPF